MVISVIKSRELFVWQVLASFATCNMCKHFNKIINSRLLTAAGGCRDGTRSRMETTTGAAASSDDDDSNLDSFTATNFSSDMFDGIAHEANHAASPTLATSTGTSCTSLLGNTPFAVNFGYSVKLIFSW